MIGGETGRNIRTAPKELCAWGACDQKRLADPCPAAPWLAEVGGGACERIAIALRLHKRIRFWGGGSVLPPMEDRRPQHKELQ